MSTKRLYPIFNSPDESSSSTSKRTKPNELHLWSWNVAGLRACVKKGGATLIEKCEADIVMLQETKCDVLPPEVERIQEYPFKKLFVSKDKKGHSGVAFLSRERPLKCTLGFGNQQFDAQGRFIHAEFEDFHIINVYVPNSGQGLKNLTTRMKWNDAVFEKLKSLDQEKPVIYAGDMNVAHNEIDLKNPETNRNKTAGFTDEEREDFTRLLGAGFIDVYRRMNPDSVAYTYFSYMRNARAKNIGWRLDYFVVSERIFDKVLKCRIHDEVKEGSDHIPISLVVKTF